jgi:calcineurin-like phosphoesterase family protein
MKRVPVFPPVKNMRKDCLATLRRCRMNVTFFCWLLLLTGFDGCSLNSIYVNSELAGGKSEPIGDSSISQSVFLIGDAGEQTEGIQEPVLGALERQASKNSARNLIVFLGDNVYENGMPEPSNPERPRAERRLGEQIETIERSGADGVFIPGNHDWGSSSADAVASVIRQNEFIASRRSPKVRMLPLGGMPGPEVIDFGERVRLVALDTEWWLQRSSKPFYPGPFGEAETKKAFIDSLSASLKSAGDRTVIVVGHHPLDSHGVHGGFFDWRDHLFPLRNISPILLVPLPGIGSLYPFLRNQGATNEDLSGSAYREMKKNLEEVFSRNPPLVYAAGHEHVLEVLKSPGRYLLLVSGYGTSKHDPSLTTGENTIFAHRYPGFMRLDLLRDGRVRLGVIEPIDDSGEPTEVFSMWVK